MLDAPGATSLDHDEAARAVVRALALPEIVAVRDRLVPEFWVSSSIAIEGGERVISGIADAVAVEADGAFSLVVDWKSDVAPDEATLARYRAQLAAYLDATGAAKGLLVLLTHGITQTVEAERSIAFPTA